jgi:hypothetical protein
LPPELKAGRDTREPGKAQKEAAEQALYKLMRKFWLRQRERIQQWLEPRIPMERKSSPLEDALDDAFGLFWPNETVLLKGYLIDALSRAARDGVDINDDLTQKRFGLIFDTTLTNAQAAAWAREYAGALARRINETTRDALKESVANWIETPGATVKDLIDELPFGEKRGSRIAITEITGAYANGERIYTQALQREYPSLEIIRIWYTNNDARVCDICAPLDGKEIPADGFWDEEGYLDSPPAHPG